MAWFGDRLLRWGRFRRSSAAAETPRGAECPETGPDLFLLVPDAFGAACYSLRRFPSAEPAEAFLEALPGNPVRDGVAAFWALTWKPARRETAEGGSAIEPVVLIRDEARPGLVYLFSFAAFETAESFVRQEVSSRLGPALVSVYWAAPAAIEADSRGAFRLRGDPPRRPDGWNDERATTATVPEPRAPIVFDRPEASIEAVREAAPGWQIPERFGDGWRAGETAIRSHSRPETGQDAATAGEAPDHPAEEPADDELAALFEEVEATLAAWILRSPEWQERWDRIADMYDGGGPARDEEPPHIVKPECVDGLLAEIEAEIALDPRDVHPPSEPEPDIDVTEEVRKVLRTRRWDPLDEPFHGFNSPPGRF